MISNTFANRTGFIWHNGEMRPWSEATAHVLSHGLHYASSVFEGERAYAGKIFRSREHAERFRKSAEILGFEIPYDVTELEKAKESVLKANGLENCYVRPLAFRGSEKMAISARGASVHVAIAAWPWPTFFPTEKKMKGIRLDVAEYRRPDPRTAPCQAKAAGGYMIATISKERAEAKGYDDALMLDWKERVAECTGANVFFVKNDVIHTPIADCFLDGITRRVVIELAKSKGLEVLERRILPQELEEFNECFVTGTAAEVSPVSEIGPHGFTPGEVTAALTQAYKDEVLRHPPATPARIA